MEIIKRSMVETGWSGAGMNRQCSEDFQGSENILYDTIMIDTCLIINLSKPI